MPGRSEGLVSRAVGRLNGARTWADEDAFALWGIPGATDQLTVPPDRGRAW
jgi:hypothetical protein